MAFKIPYKEEFRYSSPQEMYQDNKLKSIPGPLDYQTSMLDLYMKNINKKSLALELPTGSGKTLIGLLIGEYRRRKNKEKVLFLCPTNQLVNQVVEQASTKYGIKTIPFCGRQSDYLQRDKTDFLSSSAIGVTTYSSFFSLNTFFEDIDILIMDDVHSCEDYIISNWTINISSEDGIFTNIAGFLKPYISEVDYKYLVESEYDPNIIMWCNMVPMPMILNKIGMLNDILKSGTKDNASNYFAYKRISEHLQDCNIFIANKKITIRPWIAPTEMFSPFFNAKQRILMSATLGKSGELERITGISNISRLPIVNDWDKKGIGRRFFIFPDLELNDDEKKEIVIFLQNTCKKSVVLLPDNRSGEEFKNLLSENIRDIDIFNAKDIEISKQKFLDSNKATVILANRFDGIDFPDNQSRLLIINELPKTTNLQEKFLYTKMGASKLYAERILTRIIQSVGRCTRNAGDYSVVCVMGDSIQNRLIKPNNQKKFQPELRAEIEFGLDNSKDDDTGSNSTLLDSIKENVYHFLKRDDAWEIAENGIVRLRDNYMDEVDEVEEDIHNKLRSSAAYELDFQYYMWKGDYKSAFNSVVSIVSKLKAHSLNGYRAFWSYMAGCVAYYMIDGEDSEYKKNSIIYFKKALDEKVNIRWLSKLLNVLFKENKATEYDFFDECIERIEKNFISIKTQQRLEKKIEDIISDLKSNEGKSFERGHRNLGELLGYMSVNPSESGAPDPYWIINENNIIVSEDKIYKETDSIKKIPISAVDESNRHPIWIQQNLKDSIISNANIYNIFITNSNGIEEDARIYAEDIYYVNREKYVEWAIIAVNVIRNIWCTFIDDGDISWRDSVHKEFINNSITPKDYLSFVCGTKLKDL